MDLGSILGAALTAAGTRTPETLRQLAHCELLAGQACARWLAARYGLTEAEAWDGLTLIPDEVLGMLKTPLGWAALGEMVALRMGAATHRPLPSPPVH